MSSPAPEPAPEPFFDDVVIDFSLHVDENEADVDEVQEKSAEKSSDGKEVESVRRGSQWSSGELIAAFLSFEAARRSKSTSTKTYRAEFAGNCFPKFAAQLKKEGLLDDAVDIENARVVRFKYNKVGKNSGESAAYRKVAEVKKEVMNVILPIFEKLAPGGVPPSGIQWEEIMLKTKIAFFNIWKKGKKRYEVMDEPDAKWPSLEYDVFEYLGPRES